MADGKPCVQGDDPEDVWRKLHQEAGKADPRYFGYSGARARFLAFFPDGFRSPGFIEGERKYKLRAAAKLGSTASLDSALHEKGLGESILTVFHGTNLLSPFEKTRLQGVLRGPSADAFVKAAAVFAVAPSPSALRGLEAILRPYDCAKWAVVTYLPFLWRPEAHMFLKPEVTKDFAIRVGHAFADTYETSLNLAVYRSLLDLVDRTAAELADLGPRDRIDIQSFIWIVGKYREGRDGERT
jgi:hypothetical protein